MKTTATKMKVTTCEKIFANIGLTRDEIVALASNHRPLKLKVKQKSGKERPRCPICGNEVGLVNCKPYRQPELS